MALPLQVGLTPMEVAFLCEMEMVTVVPRQRLESLNLLSVSSSFFDPTKHSPSPSLFCAPLNGLKLNFPH
jgi:GINS complex subunit 2